MKLHEILDVLEDLYPPATAEEWDRVGLVCGDPNDEVRRVVVAMDPTEAVVADAVGRGADLVITHHPLYLRGTSSVAATDPKGRVVHRLIKAGAALYAAHTNADKAEHGTNATLARLLGLRDVRALVPDADAPGDAGGLGRVGRLETPLSLAEFAAKVAAVLPATTPGILAGGPADAEIRVVALCTGAGDSLLETARASGADVYVTADLRHHPASEHLEVGPPWLVNGTHYATEAIVLPEIARVLRDRTAAAGHTIEVHVSDVVSDPWTLHIPTPSRPPSPSGAAADAPRTTDDSDSPEQGDPS